MSFFLINFYGTDMGTEEGKHKVLLSANFFEAKRHLSTSLCLYIPVSFFQMSVMHSKPISDEEIGQNILSLSSIFEGIIYCVFWKKVSDFWRDGCWESFCSDFIFVRCWNKIKNIPTTEIEKLLLFLWICQLEEYERMVIWFQNSKPAFKRHWIMVPMETESQIPS